MPIREKSTYKKFEFEYVSPDGDVCEIVIVEHGDRKYVQFGLATGAPVVMDGEMLLDMADKYRDIMFSRNRSKPADIQGSSKRRIAAPRITDHRSNAPSNMPPPIEEEAAEPEPVPVRPQRTVIYSNDRPVLEMPNRVVDGVDYDQFQTGIDRSALDGIDETPEEWKIRDKDDEELTGWQREAASRAQKERPRIKQRGAKGEGFHRIGANELI